MPDAAKIYLRGALIWAALATAVGVPIAAAAASPLLAWREPVYIAAGFAGVIALALLLIQPLLAAGMLPGLDVARGRWAHRWVGVALLSTVIVHVAGLWITSPPDVIDALLLVSPTPFSVWGVAAMWAIFATAALAALRKPARVRWRSWRIGHSMLAVIIVIGTVIHAILIEGTMEQLSKWALCALVVLASVRVLGDRQVLRRLRRG